MTGKARASLTSPASRAESRELLGASARCACPAAPALPPVDVGRLVGDISRTFNPLARGFEMDAHASQLPGGMVQLSVVLPQGMTRAFAALLESLSGLVRFVDHKAVCAAAAAKAIDLDELEQRQQVREDYRHEVCALFDGFTASGLDRKEATRRTSQALKAKNHPWATLDLVTLTLRECGRFRRGSAGRPRGAPAAGR
jgi:hypothetical protein